MSMRPTATPRQRIATEALQRIAQLYAIEKDIRRRNPRERAVRQDGARLVIADLEPWLREKLALIGQKCNLAEWKRSPVRGA